MLTDRAVRGCCGPGYLGSFSHCRSQSKALKGQAARRNRWQEQRCHYRLYAQMLYNVLETMHELDAG